MKILGISAYYHDSAAAVIEDGRVLAAAQEERFTRIKNDATFPVNACRYCLDYSGWDIDDLDAVAFYDKPFLKFERLLETHYAFAPKGLRSFIAAMPVWVKEKLFLKNLLRKELGKLGSFDPKNLALLFPEHHLSHAASAFYPSPYGEAAIVTMDGVGEWATTTIAQGSGKTVEVLRELRFPHSLGLFYSSFTYWLGFVVNSGEYKLMGLAPYGQKKSERVRRMVDLIRTKLIDVKEDGSFRLDQSYFSYAVGSRMVDDTKWSRLFEMERRLPESKIEQAHCDLACAAQIVTEEIVLSIAAEAQRLTGQRKLCLAGGVALNCVANGRLLRSGIFDEIYIQPAAGDAGGALGAALAVHHLYYENDRSGDPSGCDKMQGSLLGPEYAHLDIARLARKYHAPNISFAAEEELLEKTAQLLDQGAIVGWFQDRMEFGPRALGNRSILADPRDPDMQQKLNALIKFRENFRPFAPSVLTEDANDLFDMDCDSPYMLMTATVRDSYRNPIPHDFHEWELKKKLAFKRSDLPGVTHVDFSSRIQTVSKEQNPRFWKLLHKFKARTGFGVLINTSFNVRGEPLVCSPEDAYRCFMRTGMDYLVLGNCLFDKKDQPENENLMAETHKHQLD